MQFYRLNNDQYYVFVSPLCFLEVHVVSRGLLTLQNSKYGNFLIFGLGQTRFVNPHAETKMGILISLKLFLIKYQWWCITR